MVQEIKIEDVYKAIMNVQHDIHDIRQSLLERESDEDQAFREDTRQAQREIDSGEGVTQSRQEFLQEIDSW